MKFARYQPNNLQPEHTFKLSIQQHLLTYRGVSYMRGGDRQLSNLQIAHRQHLLTYRGVHYSVRKDSHAI